MVKPDHPASKWDMEVAYQTGLKQRKKRKKEVQLVHQFEMHSPKKPDCLHCIEAKTKRTTKEVTKTLVEQPFDGPELNIGVDLMGPMTPDPDGNIWVLNAVEAGCGIGAAEGAKTKTTAELLPKLKVMLNRIMAMCT